MKQSWHLNPSEETGTGCPVTSKYGWTPPNKHGGMGREQHPNLPDEGSGQFHHEQVGGVGTEMGGVVYQGQFQYKIKLKYITMFELVKNCVAITFSKNNYVINLGAQQIYCV